MDYPSEISPLARNRIEAEKITAYRGFEEAKRAARWNSEVEALLTQCILRVFLAFAREACALGKRDAVDWSLDRIDKMCREFLRRITIEAWYEKGFGNGGGRLRSVTSRYTGLIDDATDRAFSNSVEWQKYQDLLLKVADGPTTGSVVPRTKPGPKRNLETARKVAGIVNRLAPSNWPDKLDDICEALDEQEVSRPTTWRKKGINSWLDAAVGYPDLARKAVGHHLKNAPHP